MLKDKEFWSTITELLLDEHSDYVVLDLYYRLSTYSVLTNDISQLPVSEDKFKAIYHSCQNRTSNILSDRYLEYSDDLYDIMVTAKEDDTLSAVKQVLKFIQLHKEPVALFCVMGVLRGVEECTTDIGELLYLKKVQYIILKGIKLL